MYTPRKPRQAVKTVERDIVNSIANASNIDKSESILWGDLETYCEIPITNGTHAYAEGVEVMLFAWAIGDEPVSVWDLTAGEPIPSRLRKAIADPDTLLYFHNSHFDRTVLRHAMPELAPPVER